MGNNTPDAFREKLEQRHARKHPDFQIHDYKQVDYAYGCTVISYNEYLRPKTHLTHFLMFPVTPVMDVLIRKYQRKRVLYFHTGNGAYLGSSENEAINRANEIGEQKMKLKEYEIGINYFNIGYNLCKKIEDSRSSTFIEKMKKAEGEVKKLEKEREAREQEERDQEAREQEEREQEKREQEAREQETRTQEKREQEARGQAAREREKREQEGREEKAREEEAIKEWKAVRVTVKREAEERVAKNCFEQGQQLWSKAFSLEISNKSTEAKATFEICVNLLSKAATLVPGNEQYSNWHKAVELKLEGDKLFNAGMSLEEREAKGYTHLYDGYTFQEQGTQLLETQNYKEALAKYKEALQKYREGFERSRDSRFEACMVIVEDSIVRVEEKCSTSSLKTYIEKVELNSNSEQTESSLQSLNYLQQNSKLTSIISR